MISAWFSQSNKEISISNADALISPYVIDFIEPDDWWDDYFDASRWWWLFDYADDDDIIFWCDYADELMWGPLMWPIFCRPWWLFRRWCRPKYFGIIDFHEKMIFISFHFISFLLLLLLFHAVIFLRAFRRFFVASFFRCSQITFFSKMWVSIFFDESCR